MDKELYLCDLCDTAVPGVLWESGAWLCFDCQRGPIRPGVVKLKTYDQWMAEKVLDSVELRGLSDEACRFRGLPIPRKAP